MRKSAALVHAPGGARPQRALLFATAALAALGLLLRGLQYAFDQALWFDEARNAFEILKPGWREWLPPHVQQPVPIGFLLVERGVASVASNSEWSLRALPFAASLATLVVAARLARRHLEGVAVPLAVGLVALSGPAIYFAAELKPYASDGLVFLGFAGLWLRFSTVEAPSARAWAGLALAGVLAPWFSYSAVFPMAVLGSLLFAENIRRGDFRGGLALIAVGTCWLVSFAFHYGIAIAAWRDTGWLNLHWQATFPAAGAGLAVLAGWGFDAFVAAFRSPLGLGTGAAWVAAAAFVLGSLRAWRDGERLLLFFVACIALVFACGLLGLYPFEKRLLLFVLPALAFPVAHGIAWLPGRGLRVLGAVALAVWLLAHPASMALGLLDGRPIHGSGHTHFPGGYEGLRPVLPGLQAQWRQGDRIHLYHGAEPEFRYYARRAGFDAPFTVGERSVGAPEGYRAELDALAGEARVWVVFAHPIPAERKLFLEHLDTMGERLDSITSPLADAHLYDLRGTPRQP